MHIVTTVWYDTRMKLEKQSAKPAVAPPASYRGPSLPTLAALGLLTAATTLTGCKPPVALGGDPGPPAERGGVGHLRGLIEAEPRPLPGVPAEKGSEEPLDGEIVLPGEIMEPSEPEKPAPTEEKVLILVEEGGVVAMPELENEF